MKEPFTFGLLPFVLFVGLTALLALRHFEDTQDKVVDNPSVSPDKQITETNDHPVDSNEKPGIDSNSKKLDAQEKIEPHDKKNDTHTDELRKDEKPSSSDKPTTERKLSKKLTGKDD